MLRIVPVVSKARIASLCGPTTIATLPRRSPVIYLPHRSQYIGAMREREPCKQPPPPPPPPPKDDRLFWGGLAAAIITSAFVVYAKLNPEIRDWLTIYAPWFDDFIALVYQENLTYEEQYQAAIKYVKNKMKEQECVDGVKPIPKPDPPAVEICDKKDNDDVECIEEGEHAIEHDICEVERCLKDLYETQYINYMTARDACRFYNCEVQETLANFTFDKARALKPTQDERNEIEETSHKNVAMAKKKAENLLRFLECGLSAPDDKKDYTQKSVVEEWHKKIAGMKLEYDLEKDKSSSYDQNWTMVLQFMDNLTKETATLFPGTDLEQKKPTFGGDMDLYLIHSSRKLKKMRADLIEEQNQMTKRVDGALAGQDSKEDQRNAEVKKLHKKKKDEMEREYKKRMQDLKAELDKEAKNAIQRQKDRHEKTMKEKVAKTERDFAKCFDKMVKELVDKEKQRLNAERDLMSQKLQIVEAKLKTRLNVDKERKKAQDLYEVGTAILVATRKGDPCVRVDKELKTLEKVSAENEDKLVKTVLGAIPVSVRQKGVVPESQLREKYHSMETTALRVAMVETEGSPLPVYFLSWIQSSLLFMKFSSIPKNELDNPPDVPPEHLDTFDLLQRARYYVDHGNLALAFRYVTALQGASRVAVDPWVEDAKAHLEMKQAAETVITHAVSTKIKYMSQ